MINYSIAITTYITEKTYKHRFKFFSKCISSLIDTKFEGMIYIIDDCSSDKRHLEWVRGLANNNIEIVEKEENGGIAKAKNTSIRKCLENPQIEYFFLSDDDMVFLKEKWWEDYFEVSEKTKIFHFSFSATNAVIRSRRPVVYNGVKIAQQSIVDGCFLFCTKELITEVGYFKIMPAKYGHEHSNFSVRAIKYCGGFFSDLINSSECVRLYEDSSNHKSVQIDEAGFEENAKYVFENKKQPCIE